MICNFLKTGLDSQGLRQVRRQKTSLTMTDTWHSCDNIHNEVDLRKEKAEWIKADLRCLTTLACRERFTKILETVSSVDLV